MKYYNAKIKYNYILIYLIIALFILAMINQNIYAKEVYQWTDSEGTTHITDNKAKIPEEFGSTVKELKWNDSQNNENILEDTLEGSSTIIFDIPYVDGIVDTEYERELREKWRAKAIEIEEQENKIKYKIDKATEDHKYKKREVDWYLRNGYTADLSINELKGLERYIKDLEEELTTIQPKIDALRIEARKAGIPEGYLRE
jgi:hypothetical protein